MPSYLVSAKESFVPMSLYKPPIEALGDMLRIKQQQYLQGFNAVSTNYNSIANAQITDETGNLKAVKDQYLSQATNQLKDLSKVDLSLQQNVEAANKVFDPMFNDQALMTNIRGTSHNDAQIQKIYAMRDSKDEKERALYDPAALEYLLNDRDKLAKAGTDLTKYKDFQYRKAVPFTNIQQYLDEEAIKEKATVVHSNTNGAYIVKKTNGAETKINYATWAQSKLDNSRFVEQFSILGDNEYNQRLRLAGQDPRYAGFGEEQLKSVVRDEMKTAVKSNYTDQITRIATQLELNKQEVIQLGSVSENPTDEPSKRAWAKFQELKNQKEALELQQQRLESAGKDVDVMLDRNPKGYFGQLARQRTIDSWAVGKSTMDQTEISENTAYFSAKKLELDWEKHRLDIRKENREDLELQYKVEGKLKSDGSSNSSSGTDSGSGGGTSTGAVQIGTATNEVKNNGQAWDMYQKKMTGIKERVIEGLYNTNSGVVRVLSKLGVSDEDIMYYGSAMANEESDNNYNFTKEQTAAAKRIAPILETATGIKITGPGTAKQAMFKAAEDYFAKAHKEKLALDPEMGNVMMSFNLAHTSQMEGLALKDMEKKMITKNVTSRPEYSSLVVERDGEKNLVSRGDLAKNFSKVQYVDENGQTKRLNRDQQEALVDQYMGGKNPFTYGQTVAAGPGGMYMTTDVSKPKAMIDGKEVNLVGPVNEIYRNLTMRHGTPDQFKTTYAKALNSIVPNEKYFQDRTGQVDTEMILPFITDAKHRGEMSVRVMQDLSSTSNVGDFFVTDKSGNRTAADAQTRTQILGMLRDEDTIEKFFDNPTMIPAQGLVKFRLKPGLSKDVLEANGLDKLVNQDFVAKVSPNAKGAALNQLAVSDAFYTHGQLLEGKPVVSSPLMNSAGFSFKILPSKDDGTANTATIHFTYKQWKDGDWVDATAKSEPFPIKGPGAISPDVLYNNASSMIFRQWNDALKASNSSADSGKKVNLLSLYNQ